MALGREEIPAGSVVGFYGDSLTVGLGASSPSRRWATLLSGRRGWNEINPSVSGLGFLQAKNGTDPVAAITAASPDLVIIALGHNDLQLVDRRGREVQAAIESELTRLRADLPDARILVFALFSPLTFEPPQVVLVNGWLRATAGAIDATFVAASSSWLVGHPEWTTDGIHFSDAGNVAIAHLIEQELDRVL